jgi:acetyl esterase/lipase
MAIAIFALPLNLASTGFAWRNIPAILESETVQLAQQNATVPSKRHLSPVDTVGHLLAHPAFTGFAELLLPWDNRGYDESMRLSDIGRLLPYHSHVDPKVVVGALNRMIDEANAGTRIFHDFYTPAQKRDQPSKKHAGLFFFPGKPGARFAVIAPGGGLSYVGSVHEGFPYAAEISDMGYNAFVLKYRAGMGAMAATEDLAAAISYIFANAGELGVSIQNYSVWGSSAGARVAAAIGSHGVSKFGGRQVPRPSTVVMAYTGHFDYSRDEPPTFVVVGEQDAIAPPHAMEARIAALRRAGTEVEYHRYKNVGHGFGPGVGTSAEGWISAAVRFWEKAVRDTRQDDK